MDAFYEYWRDHEMSTCTRTKLDMQMITGSAQLLKARLQRTCPVWVYETSEQVQGQNTQHGLSSLNEPAIADAKAVEEEVDL